MSTPTGDNANASGQTVEKTPPVTTPEITDDFIKSHPLFKELETKHAAARTGMDKFAIENKRLKTLVVGEEATPSEPEPKPATTNDLVAMKDEIRWELKNEQQIELANKNGKYDEYLAQGKAKADALKLALFDEGISNNAKNSEIMRQAAASTPAQGIDRSDPDSPIEGITKAYYNELKAKKLDDKQIKEIVRNALERANKRK
ncbi:hypothetical protein [Caudoviricetes sp.]|nr:hypothetical protein [Caudoviricetes sp.]